MAVPAEQPTTSCANCGAALVADQRYCLSCGKPASPVRLAFLEVLQDEPGRGGQAPPPAWAVPATIELGSAGYQPVGYQPGLNGWLRRNSGLLGLVAVLLMCLFVGLLVGHWASQKNTPAQQVYKIEGNLGAAGGAGAAASGTTTPSSTAPAASAAKSSAAAVASEAAENKKVAAAEKSLAKKVVAVTPASVKKLSSTHGKQHQAEINALGNEPIEVK